MTWGILYALLLPGKGLLDKGWVLAIMYTIIVGHSAYLFLKLNHHGWREQSDAGNRHRRRHWVDDAAECLCSDLAHPEAAHCLDYGECRERHSYA
jgi:hypothetical protein